MLCFVFSLNYLSAVSVQLVGKQNGKIWKSSFFFVKNLIKSLELENNMGKFSGKIGYL